MGRGDCQIDFRFAAESDFGQHGAVDRIDDRMRDAARARFLSSADEMRKRRVFKKGGNSGEKFRFYRGDNVALFRLARSRR